VNKFLKNIVTQNITIEAQGGYGTNGGSGGIIVLDGGFVID